LENNGDSRVRLSDRLILDRRHPCFIWRYGCLGTYPWK